MSGNAQARQALSVFIAEALQPQAADLGGDPGYLLVTATGNHGSHGCVEARVLLPCTL